MNQLNHCMERHVAFMGFVATAHMITEIFIKTQSKERISHPVVECAL